MSRLGPCSLTQSFSETDSTEDCGHYGRDALPGCGHGAPLVPAQIFSPLLKVLQKIWLYSVGTEGVMSAAHSRGRREGEAPAAIDF